MHLGKVQTWRLGSYNVHPWLTLRDMLTLQVCRWQDGQSGEGGKVDLIAGELKRYNVRVTRKTKCFGSEVHNVSGAIILNLVDQHQSYQRGQGVVVSNVGRNALLM